MPTTKTLAAAILATVLALGLACSGHKAAGAARGTTCSTPLPPNGCWEQLRPLGNGGFPDEPGSNDRPKWAPGKFPLGLAKLFELLASVAPGEDFVFQESPRRHPQAARGRGRRPAAS